jgi:FdhE protein
MPSGRTSWDARIARARRLSLVYPAASDLLRFYASLAEYQKALAGEGLGDPLAAISDFLVWLDREPTTPPALAEAAADLRRLDAAEWRRLLNRRLTPNPESRIPNPESVAFVVEAVSQPFAEAGACCRELPALGVLREEGQGARRTLLCGLCLTEREYLRVVCPACGEQKFDALPVYTAEQFAHVRIDACDSCRRYLKTIDLSKDGLADPIVDDLASIAMDLWAREQGYVRTRPNLLRA